MHDTFHTMLQQENSAELHSMLEAIETMALGETHR